MKIEEYVVAVQNDLIAFVASYNSAAEKKPESYPQELSEEQWDEQLAAFFMLGGRNGDQS